MGRRRWVVALFSSTLLLALATAGACGGRSNAREDPADDTLSDDTPAQNLADPYALRDIEGVGGKTLRAEVLRDAAPAAQAYLDGRSRQWAVAVAALDQGTVWVENADTPFPLASVMKPAIMITFLNQLLEAQEPLSDEDASLLTAMIVDSNNDSALELWTRVGGGRAVDTYLRSIGITGIYPARGVTWGDSTATASGVVQLFAHIAYEDILDPAFARLALRLLTDVSPSQRWGVSAALETDEPGWAVGIKDGWYSGLAGWRVNSAGLAINPDGKPTTIAVVLTKNQESLEYGQETIEAVAERIRSRLSDARAGIPSSDTAPLPVPLTEIQRFVPAPSARVEESGACNTRSTVANRPGAYRCATANGIFDPCFALPDDAGQVVCDTTPDDPNSGFAVAVEGALPKGGPVRLDNPWRLELDDGTVCTFFRSGVIDDDLERNTYACSDGKYGRGNIQRGQIWSIRKTGPELEDPVDTRIVRAWY